MTLSEIARYRVRNQQLVESKLISAIDMVEWLGAVQGQEYAQTKWGLGLRLPNLSENDIEQDFTDGKILRTHLLRPTWHLVSANDIRWLLMLTAPRVNAINAYMYRQLELDKKVFFRCNKILEKTLQGGKQLSREIINKNLKKNKIEAEGFRLSYIMMNAELAGLICSGPRNGNQFTYALLEERVAKSKTLSYDEALTELTKRYFQSRGPATLRDFSTWSGLALSACKKGLEMTKGSFERVLIEKEEYYFIDTISSNKKSIQGIYLLPIYDELIMGYKDRTAMMVFKNRFPSAPKFLYNCMLVVDGQIIGTWKRTVLPKHIEAEFEFFSPLNKKQRKALDIAIHRLEKFTNMPVSEKNTRAD